MAVGVCPVGPGRWCQMPPGFREHVALVRAEYAHAPQENAQAARTAPVMPGASADCTDGCCVPEKDAQRRTRLAQEGTR